MKKALLIFAAVGALALTACSSDNGSDASPGGDGNNQTPQASNHDFAPSGSNICELLANTDSMGDDLSAAQDDLDALMDDQANWDSPEAVAALHAQGQAMLEYSDDLESIFTQAAGMADDPEVSDAFALMADYFQMMFEAMGQAAVDSDSVMDYLMNIGTYVDQDQIMSMNDDLSDASTIISDYVYSTCGYSDLGF